MAILILVSILSVGFCNSIDNFNVHLGSTFVVQVHVEGSRGSSQTMVFDTGSTHSWIFDYQYLEDKDAPVGGYSHTQVRTYLDIPDGASRISYEDNDVVECDTWTHKSFTLGHTTWDHEFGIVVNAHRRHAPQYTGLMAGGRDSEFVSRFPIFSFNPRSKHEVQMYLGSFDVSETCLNGIMGYGDLAESGTRFGSHWYLKGPVVYGTATLGTGSVIDTGASVIGLPPGAFELFANQFKAYTSNYEYFAQKLHGIVDCPDSLQLSLLPSFELVISSSQSVSITPGMYIMRLTANECLVNVARLSSASTPIIFGLPLLRNIATQFDSVNERIGFCQSNNWIHDGGIHDYSYTKNSYSALLGLSILSAIFIL